MEDAAIAVAGDRIVAVGPDPEIAVAHAAAEEIEARGMAAIPGLIDCHSHAGHGLVRSLGAGDGKAWYDACAEIYARGSTVEFWARRGAAGVAGAVEGGGHHGGLAAGWRGRCLPHRRSSLWRCPLRCDHRVRVADHARGGTGTAALSAPIPPSGRPGPGRRPDLRAPDGGQRGPDPAPQRHPRRSDGRVPDHACLPRDGAG